jgi:uncharacterized protein (DUF433 family)
MARLGSPPLSPRIDPILERSCGWRFDRLVLTDTRTRCCAEHRGVGYLSERRRTMDEADLLQRITVNPEIFGGKLVVRGRRLAVEHVPGMLAAGDTPEVIPEGYPWLEPEDIRACLIYARRLVGHERVEPLILKTGT